MTGGLVLLLSLLLLGLTLGSSTLQDTESFVKNTMREELHDPTFMLMLAATPYYPPIEEKDLSDDAVSPHFDLEATYREHREAIRRACLALVHQYMDVQMPLYDFGVVDEAPFSAWHAELMKFAETTQQILQDYGTMQSPPSSPPSLHHETQDMGALPASPPSLHDDLPETVGDIHDSQHHHQSPPQSQSSSTESVSGEDTDSGSDTESCASDDTETEPGTPPFGDEFEDVLGMEVKVKKGKERDYEEDDLNKSFIIGPISSQLVTKTVGRLQRIESDLGALPPAGSIYCDGEDDLNASFIMPPKVSNLDHSFSSSSSSLSSMPSVHMSAVSPQSHNHLSHTFSPPVKVVSELENPVLAFNLACASAGVFHWEKEASRTLIKLHAIELLKVNLKVHIIPLRTKDFPDATFEAWWTQVYGLAKWELESQAKMPPPPPRSSIRRDPEMVDGFHASYLTDSDTSIENAHVMLARVCHELREDADKETCSGVVYQKWMDTAKMLYFKERPHLHDIRIPIETCTNGFEAWWNGYRKALHAHKSPYTDNISEVISKFPAWVRATPAFSSLVPNVTDDEERLRIEVVSKLFLFGFKTHYIDYAMQQWSASEHLDVAPVILKRVLVTIIDQDRFFLAISLALMESESCDRDFLDGDRLRLILENCFQAKLSVSTAQDMLRLFLQEPDLVIHQSNPPIALESIHDLIFITEKYLEMSVLELTEALEPLHELIYPGNASYRQVYQLIPDQVAAVKLFSEAHPKLASLGFALFSAQQMSQCEDQQTLATMIATQTREKLKLTYNDHELVERVVLESLNQAMSPQVPICLLSATRWLDSVSQKDPITRLIKSRPATNIMSFFKKVEGAE